ncbi:MAG: DUF937 domain-containing protein [Bacteroidales bacterium]|nr:DUF937 domain-containing protein [Bacteroidales bacterium]HDS07123.1 DUF937 domain-containing protein [Bacteroides sp.]
MKKENPLSELLSQLDDNSLQKISQKTNASPQQAQSALASAIPILMNALARNSSTREGKTALQNAVKKDHDGSLLDHLEDFLNNPESANGAGILRHVLGEKRQNVEQYISKDAGLSGESASKILEIAAPMVMGLLGKKSSGSGSAISGLLNSYLKTEKKQATQSHSVISQLLDRDNDGNVMDDVSELGMSFLGKFLKRK